MTDGREQIDASSESKLPQPAWFDPSHPSFFELEDHPELVPVVMWAVDEVFASCNRNRECDAELVRDAEKAAAAAALITYERMVLAGIQASDVADEARRARAPLVAATAEGIAEVVTETGTEVHDVEEAAADYITVSEAAAINAVARADAAPSVAQAAADAAAEVAEEAASTARAAEREMISTVLDRHQDALETCYEVAAAAAQAVLTHPSGAEPRPAQHR